MVGAKNKITSKNIKVSVVVPVYKVESYIDRTLKSLLSQTLEEMEIILVDDGSPDRCPEICDQYAAEYSQVKVVHKQNAGLGMACNSGIEVAEGEYIAFCDSDDFVDTVMYQTMYDAALKYQADAVYTGIQTIDQHDVVSLMNGYPSLQVMQGRGAIQHFAMDMIASAPSCKEERTVPMSAKIVLYRKALIDQFNLRFVSERKLISEDLIWNLDFMNQASCVVALPKTFYYYYKNNSASLCSQLRLDRFSFYKILREDLLKRCRSYHYPQEVVDRINRMFIGYCRFYIGSICTSSLPSEEKQKLATEICTDDVWKEVWKDYPMNKMPVVHRLMAVFMKWNCFTAMNLIYKLKRR